MAKLTAATQRNMRNLKSAPPSSSATDRKPDADAPALVPGLDTVSRVATVGANGARPAPPPQPWQVLQWQGAAGNHAVSGVLNRLQRTCEAPPPPAPKLEPATDPKFQKVKGRIGQVGALEKKHPPASAKVAEAQQAASGPANEVASKAAAAQVASMDQQKPGEFDKKAFVAAVRKAIEAATPQNLEQVDDFKRSGRAGNVKQDVGGLVTRGKEQSARAIKQKTEAPPDASGAAPKPVTSMAPEKPGAPPPEVGAATAMPDAKPGQETSMASGPCEVNSSMAEANVTEDQLRKSNEPEFNAALDAKKDAEVSSSQAPAEYRAAEKDTLQHARGGATAEATKGLDAMHSQRVGSSGAVEGDKTATKTNDEAERTRIATELEAVYTRTRTDVTAILDGLDARVNTAFDEGERAARTAFENLVETRMAAYKNARYGGDWGAALWLKDKLTMSLPSEVNVFYDEGRKLYMAQMDAAVDRIADVVGGELNRAKARIAQGRAEVTKLVDSQPKQLRELAQESAQQITARFDELDQSVQDKQAGVIDSLAQKYVEARDKLDNEINQKKEQNKSWIDKAKEKINGVIETIKNFRAMLEGVLARAAGVINQIADDPIKFLGNLTSAIKMGLDQFKANIGQHLKAGLLEWLFGEIGGSGITMPDSLDFKGILHLVLQVLGLTWDNLKAQIVKMVGPAVMAGIEKGAGIFQKVAGIIQRLMTEGPIALWDMLQEKLADLKDMVIGQIQDFLIGQIITAGITWLLSLLNPASAFIKACKMIYDVIMFFVNNGSRIMALVNAIIDGIGAIASGSLAGAARLVEDALGKAIPLAIGFLASLLGLGGLGEKIREIINAVRAPINKAITAVLKPIVTPLKKLWAKGAAWVKGKVEKGKAWAKAKIEKGKSWAKKKLGLGDDPASQQQRLVKGVKAGKAAVERLENRRVTAVLLAPILAVFKFRYQLSVLEPVVEQGYWAVHGEISRMTEKTTLANVTVADKNLDKAIRTADTTLTNAQQILNNKRTLNNKKQLLANYKVQIDGFQQSLASSRSHWKSLVIQAHSKPPDPGALAEDFNKIADEAKSTEDAIVKSLLSSPSSPAAPNEVTFEVPALQSARTVTISNKSDATKVANQVGGRLLTFFKREDPNQGESGPSGEAGDPYNSAATALRHIANALGAGGMTPAKTLLADQFRWKADRYEAEGKGHSHKV